MKFSARSRIQVQIIIFCGGCNHAGRRNGRKDFLISPYLLHCEALCPRLYAPRIENLQRLLKGNYGFLPSIESQAYLPSNVVSFILIQTKQYFNVFAQLLFINVSQLFSHLFFLLYRYQDIRYVQSLNIQVKVTFFLSYLS
jgi:hypothetical protein